jgi:hypothetical protein
MYLRRGTRRGMGGVSLLDTASPSFMTRATTKLVTGPLVSSPPAPTMMRRAAAVNPIMIRPRPTFMTSSVGAARPKAFGPKFAITATSPNALVVADAATAAAKGGSTSGGGGGGGGSLTSGGATLPDVDFDVPDDAPDSSEFDAKPKEAAPFPVVPVAIGAAVVGLWLLTRKGGR